MERTNYSCFIYVSFLHWSPLKRQWSSLFFKQILEVSFSDTVFWVTWFLTMINILALGEGGKEGGERGGISYRCQLAPSNIVHLSNKQVIVSSSETCHRSLQAETRRTLIYFGSQRHYHVISSNQGHSNQHREKKLTEFSCQF